MTRAKEGSKGIIAEDSPTDSDVPEEDAKDLEDVECVVNVVAPPDGDPDGRLEQILDLLREQESCRSYCEVFPTCPTLPLVKQSCEEKMESDAQAADEIRENLLKRLNELPNEFLERPATEAVLSELQIAGPANLPSCCRTKNSISRRVIRVISKDIGAAQTLAEWNKKFNNVYSRIGDVSKEEGHTNEK